jgi:hypothetical protein
MSYEEALEVAGAKVLAFEEFGDYQGTWWAKVCYKGEVGWVSGSYGSCSSCDAFEDEFGDWKGHCKDHFYYRTEQDRNCIACEIAQAEYKRRLIDFGSVYLDGMMCQEQAEKEASRYHDYDPDQSGLVYLKENALRKEEENGRA